MPNILSLTCSKTPSKCDSDDCCIISLIMSPLNVMSSTERDFYFFYFSFYLLFPALRFCFVFEWINECLNKENDTKNWSPIYKDTNVHLEWLVCASLDSACNICVCNCLLFPTRFWAPHTRGTVSLVPTAASLQRHSVLPIDSWIAALSLPCPGPRADAEEDYRCLFFLTLY